MTAINTDLARVTARRFSLRAIISRSFAGLHGRLNFFQDDPCPYRRKSSALNSIDVTTRLYNLSNGANLRR